ncbi:hypothetical protein M2322_002315 [Rhodoblastus acidophilus]|nr:hypothetical protein [Rhodoblastus acidophilus]
MFGLARDTTNDMGSSALKALMRGQSAGGAMREAALRMTDKIADMGMNALMKELLGKPGEMGGLLGSGFKDLFSGMWPFADGGVMSSSGSIPLRRYASGGVANSPQMAIFGEGSMNEAFVPLADGRSIPVTMRGGGGSQPINITHTVNNHVQGAEVQTKATRQPNGHVQLETVIVDVVNNHLARNGSIARGLQNTYGLSRSAGRV